MQAIQKSKLKKHKKEKKKKHKKEKKKKKKKDDSSSSSDSEVRLGTIRNSSELGVSQYIDITQYTKNLYRIAIYRDFSFF